jgi:hypothetical protein
MNPFLCLLLLFVSVISAAVENPDKAYEQFLVRFSRQLNQKIENADYSGNAREDKAIIRAIVRKAFQEFGVVAQKPFYRLLEHSSVSNVEIDKVAQIWPVVSEKTFQKYKDSVGKNDKTVNSAMNDLKQASKLTKRQVRAPVNQGPVYVTIIQPNGDFSLGVNPAPRPPQNRRPTGALQRLERRLARIISSSRCYIATFIVVALASAGLMIHILKKKFAP